MALDLSRTALQLDGMAADILARQETRAERLRGVLDAVESFSLDEYEARLAASPVAIWGLPELTAHPGTARDAIETPADFTVVSADGSHIDTDRHMPARCYVINTGVAALTYGTGSGAQLYGTPRLYARDDELVIKSPDGVLEQQIEGAVLGAKRAVEEVRTLVDAIDRLPEDALALALMDGSLVLIGLASQGYHEFVREELIENGFAEALEQLWSLSRDRSIVTASYISLPSHGEVIRSVHVTMCGHDSSEEANACDRTAGLLDRDIFANVLQPGQRSAVFGTAYPVVKNHYRGIGVSFFYLNVGEEIARVEVPSWIADDEAAVDVVHTLIVDQCERGRGYPVALMEAHEQAVISGRDRRLFSDLVDQVLYSHSLPVYTSEKERSKRLRWT